MRTLILCSFLCLCSLCFSQKIFFPPPVAPFEQIAFPNLNPTWYHDIFDSTFIRTDTFDGHNEFDFVYTYGDHIKNGRLYKAHVIRNYDIMGFRVSCVDIDSGDVIWSKNIDYALYNRQHTPYYQTFDHNGDLVIFGFRKAFPYDPNEDSWVRLSSNKPCKVFRLVLDKDDGTIKSYFSPDNNPDYKIYSYYGFDDWNFFGLDDHGRVEFLLGVINGAPNASKLVKRGYIDEQGNVSITDSLFYSPNNWNFSRTAYTKVNNQYYCFEKSSADKTNHIVAMDTNLLETNRVNIPNITLENNKLYYVTSTNKYLIFGQAFPSTFNYNLRYFIIDYQGNVVNTIDIKDDFYMKYSDASITYDEKHDKLLMLAYGIDYDMNKKESKSFLDILHYDGKEYETYKHITLNQPGRDFSAWQVIYDGDDNFVLDMRLGYIYYDEKEEKFLRSFGNNTSALMYVSRKELGLLSAVQEENIAKQQYQAFPNPSIGDFNILLADDDTSHDVRIFDTQGRNVYVVHQLNGQHVSLDLKDLANGSYIYCIYQKGKLITSGHWIKAE